MLQRAIKFFICILFLLNAGIVSADIWVYTKIILFGGQYSRALNPSQYPDLFPEGDEYYSHAEGNVLEQIVDFAQFANAVRGVLTGDALSAAASGVDAYHEFQQLMDSWGGKTVIAENNFSLPYPHEQYNIMRVMFYAYSEDDKFERPVFGPVGIPGIQVEESNSYSVSEDADESDWPQDIHGRRYKHSKLVTFTVDLNRFKQGRRDDQFFIHIPLAFAVKEMDGYISTLKIAKVLDLQITRQEEKPVEAWTSITFTKNELSGVDFSSRDVHSEKLMWNTLHQGDNVQSSAIQIRQSSNGQYTVMHNGIPQPYDNVSLAFYVNSKRALQTNNSKIDLNVSAHPQLPQQIKTAVYPIKSDYAYDAQNRQYQTEGQGTATAFFDPKLLPAGTYTLVFSATPESGSGGLIAQHMVKISKIIETQGTRPNINGPLNQDGGGPVPKTAAPGTKTVQGFQITQPPQTKPLVIQGFKTAPPLSKQPTVIKGLTPIKTFSTIPPPTTVPPNKKQMQMMTLQKME